MTERRKTPCLGVASLTHPVRFHLPPLPRGEFNIGCSMTGFRITSGMTESKNIQATQNRGHNIQATLNQGRARQVGGEDAQAMSFIVEHPNPPILTTPCLDFASLEPSSKFPRKPMVQVPSSNLLSL